MNVKKLEENLDAALANYQVDVSAIVSDEYSNKPVTEADLLLVSKHTYYLMNEFKNAIIESLK